jgi:hypothetical protein
VLSTCRKAVERVSVVSATFVCRVTLYASEKAVSEYQCLIGSQSTQRKYQHLSCIVNTLVAVK